MLLPKNKLEAFLAKMINEQANLLCVSTSNVNFQFTDILYVTTSVPHPKAALFVHQTVARGTDGKFHGLCREQIHADQRHLV